MTTILSALAAFERHYRADREHEHAALFDSSGSLIVARQGTADEVQFTPAELNAACLGTLTHNHPRSLPPSGDDLALAVRYGLTLRAVGVTPDGGEKINYTITVPGPSDQMADRILTAYDDAVTQAERQLVNEPLSDTAWQREARHVAVERLSQRYGFTYTRSTASGVREMSHETRRLNVISNVENVMQASVFMPLVAAISQLLLKYADGRGLIPLDNMTAVQHEAARLVLRTLLGQPSQSGNLAPYTVQHGDVIPLSPYFTALWELMRSAAALAIQRHAAIMRKYLPEDIARQYEFATLSPFDSVHEIDEPQYDPLHLWVGPDGKTLSDRIWNATGDMRRKLDQYLASAIATRTPVQQMAKELEPFLLPGAGGYEAMRLARTETAAAYSRADALSAQQNPFVETYNYFTAPEHQCCDICDDIEAGSPYPKSDVVHLPPAHPQCICSVQWNEVSNPKAVVIRLRQTIEAALSAAKATVTDTIGPLSRKFLNLLFRGKS